MNLSGGLCIKALVYGTIFPKQFKISVIYDVVPYQTLEHIDVNWLVYSASFGKGVEHPVAFRSFTKEGRKKGNQPFEKPHGVPCNSMEKFHAIP